MEQEVVSIDLPRELYDIMAARAAAQQQTPARFAEMLLAEQLLPRHPYVEVIQSRSGPRPVIRGTRIGVDVIVGYMQAGHAPQFIAVEILPQLTPAQVYDALSYYEDRRSEMDELMRDNATEVWQSQLRLRLGSRAAQLLGD